MQRDWATSYYNIINGPFPIFCKKENIPTGAMKSETANMLPNSQSYNLLLTKRTFFYDISFNLKQVLWHAVIVRWNWIDETISTNGHNIGIV